MREHLAVLLGEISGFVWGLPLIILLVGTGIFLTMRLRALQITQLGRALRIAFSRADTAATGDISGANGTQSFGAVKTRGSISGVTLSGTKCSGMTSCYTHSPVELPPQTRCH